jgi:hypothetical protein
MFVYANRKNGIFLSTTEALILAVQEFSILFLLNNSKICISVWLAMFKGLDAGLNIKN